MGRNNLFRAIFLAGVVLPALLLLMLSVGREWLFPAILPGSFTFRNWADLLKGGGDLGSGLVLNLILSAVVAVLATGLGFLTARLVQNRSVLLLAYLPYALSPVVYAVLLYVFFIRLGLSGNVAGVVLGQLLLAYPFAVIFFRSFWGLQATRYEQLALTLGCTPWQALRKVLIPVARPALVICFFQTFLISWFEFGLTNLIGIGKVKTLTVQVFVYIQEANIHYAALAALLLVIPPVVLLLANRRFVFGGGEDLLIR